MHWLRKQTDNDTKPIMSRKDKRQNHYLKENLTGLIETDDSLARHNRVYVTSLVDDNK